MKVIPISKDNQKIYDICLDDSFSHLDGFLTELSFKDRRICIVTDSQVAPLYLEPVRAICEKVGSRVVSFVFEAGEAHKNLDTIQEIYSLLIKEHFDRKDVLIALGGGVTGDMTGYAAATYLRGISFIQIPTTLLAQCDSSIGGKTGVDFRQYKNMVGAFWQPRLVYMNLNTLKTLDQRQFSSGMAEVIKHGLIKDRSYYEWLRAHAQSILNMDYPALEAMVERSCQIKRAVVENDPQEKGERALLNFGHTVGHSVEKLKDFSMLHGECVAVGIAAAADISRNRGDITDEAAEEIKDTLNRFKLPCTVSGLQAQDILAATKLDKKMDGGRIRFILLRSIGQAYIDPTVSDEELLKGIGACL